jgi:hypothetical protein
MSSLAEENTFDVAAHMEDALERLRGFVAVLRMISETLDQTSEAPAVLSIAYAIDADVDELWNRRNFLFNRLHASRFGTACAPLPAAAG